MNARLDRPDARQPAGLTPLEKVVAWIDARRQSRRARRLEEDTVADLDAMGARLRNDIGAESSPASRRERS